ncbi:inactive leucine-rich repeat receptor-like protein kinase [Dorcoceras hygrometricum]|uniref:Inactive leucine-rich repeat receptor-like protein kinase n=1 Tax=Dorcoceras hygrometricum TaxID=472368 RepID=A0A2Z7BKU7_9LAMI|nr:inactive leucine-rich repeat receptor-like protein kinase [Dorcoceras hygrometricum]
MMRRRAGESADGLALMTSSYSADGLSEQSQESADSAGRVCVVNQSQSIVVEEDSGEAIDEPDASNSSIQSRAYMNQLLLLNQSLALHPVAKIQTQERRISHTVAAVVHLRSLGVLTAAGCGIGSVHAVVRSNLLVETSEVEEGEM